MRRTRLPRWLGPAVYAVAFGIECAVRGLPLSRDLVFVWALLALVAFSLTDPRRWIRGLLLEWLPFGVILFAYDRLRGIADGLLPTHVLPQIKAEKLLFGGVTATVWLQRNLYDGPSRLHWYDYATWAVYLTHFLATLLVAAVLWIGWHRYFLRYVAMVSTLALLGFVTYVLFPAAPPWLAAREGQLGPAHRIVHAVFAHVPSNLHFDSLWESGQHYANDVAAIPSLHAAYAFLIGIFFWRHAGPWVRALLVAYPVAMSFSLVYLGEHYTVDCILGAVYAAAAFFAVELAASRLTRFRAARREPRQGYAAVDAAP